MFYTERLRNTTTNSTTKTYIHRQRDRDRDIHSVTRLWNSETQRQRNKEDTFSLRLKLIARRCLHVLSYAINNTARLKNTKTKTHIQRHRDTDIVWRGGWCCGSYFIRAVGACPPVTLNHHSHCRPYKLKLHLPLPPPSPFLLPLPPSTPF